MLLGSTTKKHYSYGSCHNFFGLQAAASDGEAWIRRETGTLNFGASGGLGLGV